MGRRSRNWHHPFPVARFLNKLPISLHDAYNRIFFGHRTAWEAAKFLRKLAGPSGVISDAALAGEARETKEYRRFEQREQKGAERGRKRKSLPPKQREVPLSYRDAFEIVFDGERRIDVLCEILNRPPWMPPGVTFLWEGNRVIVTFDYDAMKRAQAERDDIHGLFPEFE